RLALAAALRAAGRGDDADAEERRAIELWEAKGATLLVERTRRTDAPVAATTAPPQPRSAPGTRRRLASNRATEASVALNAAIARSVAGWNGPLEPDRLATTMAPLIECVDHRSLHLWSSHGADEFLGQWRGQIDLATGSAVRHDDVLALAPDILLVRQTYSG